MRKLLFQSKIFFCSFARAAGRESWSSFEALCWTRNLGKVLSEKLEKYMYDNLLLVFDVNTDIDKLSIAHASFTT